MTNQEAIARIECHMIRHYAEEPRAVYITEALKVAIEALKSQEPRVMTWGELSETKICWIEDRTEIHDRLYPAIYHGIGNWGQFYIFIVDEDDPAFDGNEESGSERWLEAGDIFQFWRPWTGKPTDDQMDETKWNEGEAGSEPKESEGTDRGEDVTGL